MLVIIIIIIIIIINTQNTLKQPLKPVRSFPLYQSYR